VSNVLCPYQLGRTRGWTGGLAAAILIGAIAGRLPAIRTARLSPTEAPRTV
jgi:putative ABC transport system permease protein